MAVIPRNYNNGDVLTAPLMNAAGNAFNGMQITDDNGGFPILGNSFIPGLSLPLGASGESAKAFAGVGTYTVPAGKWFIITNLVHANVVATDSITPSGGSAFTIAAAAAQVYASTWIVLGPGDAITLGNAGTSVSGTLINAPAGLTRILQTVSSTVTLTVPVLRRILLTAVVGGAFLQIDGVQALFGPLFDSATVANVVRPMAVGAGQVLASASATLILVNGIQYTTAT